MPKSIPVRPGDTVTLKKPHPCGVNEWEVIHLGMDIALRCVGCDRSVLLPRSEFDSRFRGYMTRAGEGAGGSRGAVGTAIGDATADSTAHAGDNT